MCVCLTATFEPVAVNSYNAAQCLSQYNRFSSVSIFRYYGMHWMLRHARLYSDTLVQNALKETEEKHKRNGSTTTMSKNSGVPP